MLIKELHTATYRKESRGGGESLEDMGTGKNS
jgi:hypothetical protein